MKFILLSVIGPFSLLGAHALVPPLSRRSASAAAAAAGATAVGVGAVAIALQKKKSSKENDGLFNPSVDSLAGQSILITGGTTGLGLETAKRLALGGPKEIILTARNHAKGQAAVVAVQNYLQGKRVLNDSRVAYKLLDLDDLQGIRDAVKTWNDVSDINVLVNNAGVMAVPDRQLTVDGFERQIQSNHLGHFLLTALLANKLRSNAKIINVSSEAHRIPGKAGLDFEYLWKGEPGYGAWKSYGQSKLANVLFSQELQRRAFDQGLDWQVASLHPGAVQTDLGRYIIGLDKWEEMKQGGRVSFLQKIFLQALSLFVKTVPEGANTHVYLASSATKEPLNGQYYVDVRPTKVSNADPAQAERLWQESEELCRVNFFENLPRDAVVKPEVIQ